MKKALGMFAVIIVVPFLAVVLVVVLLPAPRAAVMCVSVKDVPGVQADVAGLPSERVAGYAGEQLRTRL